MKEYLLNSAKRSQEKIENYHSLLKGLKFFNETHKMDCKEVGINNLQSWRFNSNNILEHSSKRFFSISGIKEVDNNESQELILLQPEIGILGVLCCLSNNELRFLVQLKIEPGNPNGFQVCPTLQATKSNYNKVHGGRKPAFLEKFNNIRKENILIDTLMPEQGMRYFQKFNRNQLILTDYFNPKHKNFFWVTFWEIIQMSSIPNLVNACFRSILSELPMNESDVSPLSQKSDLNFKLNELIVQFNDINFNLGGCKGIKNSNILLSKQQGFNINGFEITTADKIREISKWDQPLVCEKNKGEYGIIRVRQKIDNSFKYLFKLRYEYGLFHRINIGPTWINRSSYSDYDEIKHIVYEKPLDFSLDFAEEGGRFYKSVFAHKMCTVDDLEGKDLTNYILLTSSEVRSLINEGKIGMEARSLWYVILMKSYE